MIYVSFTVVHWLLLKGECILTYLEKKTLDPNYKLGSDPYRSPFYTVLGSSTMKLIKTIYLINILFIIYRNWNTNHLYPIIFLTIMMIIVNIIITKIYPGHVLPERVAS